MRAAAARMLGERDFAALGADARGRTVRHIAEVRVIAPRRARRDPGHGERLPAAHGAQRGRPPDGGRARQAGTGGGRRRPRRRRSCAPRARGAGAGTDPRARHLRISQRIEHESPARRDNARTGPESREREDLRRQGERDRAQLVGRRCDRPDPRPAGDAHRHPAGGQAQADLLAAPRHRRPRRRPQRRRRSRSPATSCGRRATSATRTIRAACARRASARCSSASRSSSSSAR